MSLPSSEPPSRLFFFCLSVIASLLALFLGLVGSFVVPRFVELMLSFGVYTLPWQFNAVVAVHDFLWTPFALTLILWWLWLRIKPKPDVRERYVMRYFLWLGAGSLMTMGFVIFSLYLPIFCIPTLS